MISGTSSRRHSDRDRIILWRAPPAQGAGATFGIATDEPFENKRLQRFTLVLHTVRHVGTSRECPAVSRVAAPRPRHHRASS